MSPLAPLLDFITTQTSSISAFPLSLAPLSQPTAFISSVLSHLHTTPVHETYYPFLRFGAMHAARVALVWSTLTRERNASGGKRWGWGQDLVGYLCMAWGGATILSLLLSLPPSWLVSSTPFLIYPPIYALLVPTSLASYITSTCPPLLLDLFGACVDGLTRGTTVSAIPTLIAASGRPALNTLYTQVLLSGVAIAGGGFLVQLFGLAKPSWELGVPSVLHGGLWGTLDFWAAGVAGLVFSALRGSHDESRWLTRALGEALPEDARVWSAKKGFAWGGKEGGGPVVDEETARAVCVMIVAGLLATRAIVLRLRAGAKKQRTAVSGKSKKDEGPGEKVKSPRDRVEVEIIKSPVSRSRGSTPRKSPKPKAR